MIRVMWSVPAPVVNTYHLQTRLSFKPAGESVRRFIGNVSSTSARCRFQSTSAVTDTTTTRSLTKGKKLDALSKPKKKRTSQNAELVQYIGSLPPSTNLSLLSKTKYLKVKRNVYDTMYLINQNVATTFIDLVEPYISDKNTTVIEFNPGLGLLTSYLSSRLGFKNINCFEDNEELRNNLKSSIENVNVIDTNFMTLPRLHHLDKLDNGSRILTALSSVKRVESSGQNDKLYVFGATPGIDFINFTIKSLVTQKILFDEDPYLWSNTDITYFIALGSRSYTILNATSELGFTVYRASTILFQLLFNYVLLGHVPRQAFIPWETKETKSRNDSSNSSDSIVKKKKRPQTIPHDPNSICVLKFSPNLQNIAKIGKSNLFTFWYFVRHHLVARSHCVIPELEQWIPGCGPKLIRKGYTIYTTFGSLTPQQILEIYLDFTSWPEFQSSSFLNAVEKYQHKVDTQEDILDFPKTSKY